MRVLTTQFIVLMTLALVPCSAQSQNNTQTADPCSRALIAAQSSKAKGVITRVARHQAAIKRLNKKCHRILKKLAPKAESHAQSCHQANDSTLLNSRAKEVIDRLQKDIKTRLGKCHALITRLEPKR